MISVDTSKAKFVYQEYVFDAARTRENNMYPLDKAT